MKARQALHGERDVQVQLAWVAVVHQLWAELLPVLVLLQLPGLLLPL